MMNLRIMDEIDLYVSIYSTRRISVKTYLRLYRYEQNFFPNQNQNLI